MGRAGSDRHQYEYLLWETPAVQEPDRLPAIARSVCARYTITASLECEARFYPYAGLSSTIRIRNGKTVIRLSDILEDAPDDVLAALIRILIAQLSRRKGTSADLQTYRDYMRTPEVEQRHKRVRLQRSRKPQHSPQGKYHHLQDSFERVNAGYFSPPIAMPTLRWSQKRSRFRLGYHDALHNQIVLSRWLDRKAVPRYVLDYVMYHEMLHIAVPPQQVNQRRIVHSAEFRKREQEFRQYRKAIYWLEGSGLSFSDVSEAIDSLINARLS